MATKAKELVETPNPDVIEREIIKGNKFNMGKFQVKRVDGGLSIMVKSDKIESFFKSLSAGRLGNALGAEYNGWAGIKYYNPAGSDIYEKLYMSIPEFDIAFDGWGKPVAGQGNKVNLAFLRAEGLTDGITMVFPGVYSSEVMKRVGDALKYGVLRLYNNYIKPYDVSVSIEATEIQMVSGKQL